MLLIWYVCVLYKENFLMNVININVGFIIIIIFIFVNIIFEW